MHRIDLNADLGEGYDDAALMPLITSANIACGAHAGDRAMMERTIALAVEHGVAVGAHPGYVDREHFGRREIAMGPGEIERLVRDQVALLIEIAAGRGATVAHVKPHGALYNQAAVDPDVAYGIARGVRAADGTLVLVGLAGKMLTIVGEELGLAVADEAFADRGYRSDGTLAPRSLPGALIEDPARAAAQALEIARGTPVATVDGAPIAVRARTLCLHGDTPGAVERARAVRRALDEAGVEVAPLR